MQCCGAGRGLGGASKFVCKFAASWDAVRQKAKIFKYLKHIGSASHQSPQMAWPRICKTLFFSTQVSYCNMSLNLSCNLSNFMLLSRNSPNKSFDVICWCGVRYVPPNLFHATPFFSQRSLKIKKVTITSVKNNNNKGWQGIHLHLRFKYEVNFSVQNLQNWAEHRRNNVIHDMTCFSMESLCCYISWWVVHWVMQLTGTSIVSLYLQHRLQQFSPWSGRTTFRSVTRTYYQNVGK